MFSLSSYIGLSSEEAMEAYTGSEEYLSQHKQVSNLIAELKPTLSDEQKRIFCQLLDIMDNSTADYVKQAYTTGVVYGIRVRDEVLIK